MAKVSKKPPNGFPSVEIKNLSQYFFEGQEDMDFVTGEPITHMPDVDVYSTPDELFIEVELPGVRKEDIEVFLHKNTMTIKALKYECYNDNKVNYVCMERVFGRLYRSIEIPFPVDTVNVKAVYKSGVLTIVVPRVEDKRNHTKKIAVESN